MERTDIALLFLGVSVFSMVCLLRKMIDIAHTRISTLESRIQDIERKTPFADRFYSIPEDSDEDDDEDTD